MFLLGLFIAVASIPGWTSVSIPAGWAAMSLMLPFVLWREVKWTPLHILLAIFLAYVAISVLWSTDYWDGAWRLWQFSLLALAFHLGSTLSSLRSIFAGLAIGGAISSALAIVQYFGIYPVQQYTLDTPAGLHYNPVFQGMILALIIIALTTECMWWYIPALLPGLWLAQSRGAFAALGLGLIAQWVRHPMLWLLAALGVIFYTTLALSPAEYERLIYWKASLANLSWLGNGAGSITDLWIILPNISPHPLESHNDFIQLVFEFSFAAIFPFATFALILWNSQARSWPIVVAFLFLSCFTFPLFTPIPAFLFALCAGHISRDPNLSWASIANRRRAFFLQHSLAQPIQSQPSREAIPT